MQQKPVIETIHLFKPIHDALIQVLKELEPDAWNKSTLATQWTVKDIVAHLLDTTTRGISILRDGHIGNIGPANEAYTSLVEYINELNAQFIITAKRWSPRLLIELHEIAGPIHIQLLTELDPFEKAIFPVAWAGEKESFNWFHVAREYTEKYHHQLQIREAVNKTAAILIPELFYPFIKTFFLGLPHLLNNQVAPAYAIIAIEIEGSMGAIAYLQYSNQEWNLCDISPGNKLYAKTIIPVDIAWKLFTKGVSPKEVLNQVILEGDQAIAFHMLNLVAVVA